MKKNILSMAIFASLLVLACNNKESSSGKGEDTTTVNKHPGREDASIDPLVNAYLDLKNALANDNKDLAASGAKQVIQELDNLDNAKLSTEDRKILDEVKADIREHAEHISGSPIDHQREHFDLLSLDMIDLIRVTGSTRTLYIHFCPMYNNKKGASWVSDAKEIRNPYYGKEMLECGELKEELKGK